MAWPGPGPGRPKGSKNRLQVEVKEVIAEAAARLGGVDRLVEWAKEDPQNERIFWGTVLPKLLPMQVSGQLDHNLKSFHQIELVGVRPNVIGPD